MVVINNADHMQ